MSQIEFDVKHKTADSGTGVYVGKAPPNREELRKLIELFCLRADSLRPILSKVASIGGPKLSLRVIPGLPPQISKQGLEHDTLVVHATLVRQFYLQNEPIAARNVHNKLTLHFREVDPEICVQAAEFYATFQSAYKVSQVAVKIGNKTATRVDYIEAWFNGCLFHTDEDWVRRWSILNKPPVGEFVIYEIECCLNIMSVAVINFSNYLSANVMPRLSAPTD